jgi:hypothetical protein
MNTLDPRSVKIIHDQKENEILHGRAGDHIEFYIVRLFTALRCSLAGIMQKLFAKSTRQIRHGMNGYTPGCEEESYHKLQV